MEIPAKVTSWAESLMLSLPMTTLLARICWQDIRTVMRSAVEDEASKAIGMGVGLGVAGAERPSARAPVTGTVMKGPAPER
jgi:hypothetical protein